MATKKSNDFVENLLEAQQGMMDTLVENTKKLTNGNSVLNEMLDKGTETLKNWTSKQQEGLKATQEKMNDLKGKTEKEAKQVSDFYKNWFDTQLNWTKKAWEMNQDFVKNLNPQSFTSKLNSNPSDWFKNMNDFWSNWTNQQKAQQQWNDWFQKLNPSNLSDNWKAQTENWQGFYKQYMELIQNSFADLQQNMQTTTTKDAYNNMINAASSYSKFYQLWAPFWNSIQDKTFNSDSFKKAINPDAIKELTDKLFGFLPEGSQDYANQMKDWWTEGMKQFFGMQKEAANSAWESFKKENPFFKGQNSFTTFLGNYQDASSWFKNAVSPIARMITPNQFTKSAAEWSDIMDQMAVYQIKNAELQYMIYVQSNEVLEKLASSVSEKLEKGEEIKSIINLYQEWLNINDSVYVQLFESDEYSKLMAEVSALQLKLRKEIEGQMEKSMVGIPVATRSELDELYKVIYDLKKEVRQLEKMLELDETSKKADAEEKTTKTSAKKSSK